MKNIIMLILFVSFSLVNASEDLNDIRKGKQLSTSCFTCHGIDGNSVNPEWPKLSGQGEKYLVKQIMDYRNDKRQDAVMSSMAKAISSDEDVLHIAAYFSSITPLSSEAKNEKLISEGEAIYRGGIYESGVAACASCHGPTGSGIPVASFPKLSGQHSEYILKQLEVQQR